ncbi:MAG: 13E12 repeat family protein [Mycobacteriaceae bacterium]|nr:13E12 repeat family protein [Mycobacteriaceae bacterium]
MSVSASLGSVEMLPKERLTVLFEQLSELAGQRNAIDGRIVEIVAEIERDGLCGMAWARSVAAVVAWKLGTTPGKAQTITTVAGRLEEFPRCAAGLRQGRLSLDQVGVIAGRAAQGSDEHYEKLARHATVSRLRTAVRLETRREPPPRPPWAPAITKTSSQDCASWRITLPHPQEVLRLMPVEWVTSPDFSRNAVSFECRYATVPVLQRITNVRRFNRSSGKALRSCPREAYDNIR